MLPLGQRAPIIPRPCAFCEISFLPRRRCGKYCSKRCAGLSRRESWIKYISSRTGPRDLSAESRYKMSLAASRRNASKTYTKGIGGIREDLGHYVRSSWEANVARYLLFTGQKYEYETKVFVLVDNDRLLTYKPDFYVNDRHIEVKGWWTDRSKKIKHLMDVQYPAVKIEYIAEAEYFALETIYAPQIASWEKRLRR